MLLCCKFYAQSSLFFFPCKFLLCHSQRALIKKKKKLLCAKDLQVHMWSPRVGGPSTSPCHHAPDIPGDVLLLGALLAWLITVVPHFFLFSATWLPTPILCQGPHTHPGTLAVLPFPTARPLLSHLRWQTRSGFPTAWASKPAGLPDASHLLKWCCGRKNSTLNYY